MTVEEFAKSVRSLNVVFDIHERDDGLVRVDLFVVTRSERARGLGTSVMHAFTDYCDRFSKTAVLVPATRTARWGTTSKGRLVEFYRRFEFVENKGETRDLAIPTGHMYRRPRWWRG